MPIFFYRYVINRSIIYQIKFDDFAWRRVMIILLASDFYNNYGFLMGSRPLPFYWLRNLWNLVSLKKNWQQIKEMQLLFFVFFLHGNFTKLKYIIKIKNKFLKLNCDVNWHWRQLLIYGCGFMVFKATFNNISVMSCQINRLGEAFKGPTYSHLLQFHSEDYLVN